MLSSLRPLYRLRNDIVFAVFLYVDRVDALDLNRQIRIRHASDSGKI